MRRLAVPTEADSSIPTMMDLTAMDTQSEGDSVDDDGEFAEHHDGMRDTEPVVNPIPRGKEIGVGQWWAISAQSTTVLQRILGEEDTESLPGSIPQAEDPVEAE